MTPIIPSLSPLFEFQLPRNISGTDFGTGYGGTVCGFHTRPDIMHCGKIRYLVLMDNAESPERDTHVCIPKALPTYPAKYFFNNNSNDHMRQLWESVLNCQRKERQQKKLTCKTG